MRKASCIILVILVACALSGCSSKLDKENNTQVVNPVRESTAAEILEFLGINFHFPEDAKNISYYIIELEGENPIAQAIFTKNNTEYIYRIQPNATFKDISGVYYEWATVKNFEVSYCSGELRCNDAKEGLCLWYDTVPGLMYSVFTEECASEESLVSLANELFVPAKDVP